MPSTGSMITQAMSSSLSRRSDSAWASLYSTVWVCLAVSASTPLEEGTPALDPLPACTRAASWAPWNPPFIFTMLSLPVKPRATLMACMVASVPELDSLTMSAHGTSFEILSMSFSSVSEGAPYTVPLVSCSLTASITQGWAWPVTRGP